LRLSFKPSDGVDSFRVDVNPTLAATPSDGMRTYKHPLHLAVGAHLGDRVTQRDVTSAGSRSGGAHSTCGPGAEPPFRYVLPLTGWGKHATFWAPLPSRSEMQIGAIETSPSESAALPLPSDRTTSVGSCTTWTRND